MCSQRLLKLQYFFMVIKIHGSIYETNSEDV